MKFNKEKRQRFLSLAKKYRDSGLSRSQFCYQENISLGSLNHWFKELKVEEAKQMSKEHFFAVEINSSKALQENHSEISTVDKKCNLEIELLNGVRLRFYDSDKN